MRRLAGLASIALALLVLGPAGAWADDRRADMRSRPHPRLKPITGPARPIVRPHPFIPCCLGAVYLPPAPPPVIVLPPPIYVIVPSPPSLVYVPTPRPEPAPEITLPTGRWARHGNGVDYPYVWVWVGPAAER
ncbi:MAG TPA: hypothetical protein VGB86_01540 [Methylomirabilota bacterium]